jgi:serine kinase of HPr protein (carbohydrate metabolism regulator)
LHPPAGAIVNGPLLVHGTTVAVEGEAILLRGPSGSGKSDLALRLIDSGAQLVADDQSLLRRAGGRVLACAPPTLRGLLEIRGVGIVKLDAIEAAPLVIIADLILSDQVERMPESRVEDVLGIPVALTALAPFEASAPAKLRLLRRALAAAPLPAIIGR